MRALVLAVASLAVVSQPSIEPRVTTIERRVTTIERRITSISGDYQQTDTDTALEFTLAADVLFEFDQATLTPAAQARLAEVVTQLQGEAGGPLTVVGHTDAVGDEAYNDDLSRRRAQAVADVLVPQLPAFSLSVEGRGEREPVAPNQNDDGSDNPDGRAANRRVEITYQRG